MIIVTIVIFVTIVIIAGHTCDLGIIFVTYSIILFPLYTQPSGPASILDKDNIAKALLEIAGKKQHSDGLREPEDIDT